MTRAASQKSPERGAALITVIMMVAIMSALAITVVETARTSLQRTANSEKMDAVRWYLLGAEAYANQLIDKAVQRGEDATQTVADWLDRPLTLPLDGGGVMQITVSDGSNCFNLNSVVLRAENGQLIASPDGMSRFALLLEVSGVQNGQTLAAALADWIDSDNATLPGGAEAQTYGGSEPLPSNTLLGDRSELSHIAGFGADVVSRIAPLVCTRPVAAPNAVNVETIRPDQARLLAAMVGRELSLANAEQLIADRPAGGWESIDAFFADPRLARLGLSETTRSLLARTSGWYVVGMRVQVEDVAETSLALVSATSGHGRVVRRVLGAGSRERQL